MNEIKLEWDSYYPQVGEDITGTLERYHNHKIMPGGFLMAVLENDLSGACGRADSDNIKILPQIVGYIYNHFPSNAWGSEEKILNFVREA